MGFGPYKRGLREFSGPFRSVRAQGEVHCLSMKQEADPHQTLNLLVP